MPIPRTPEKAFTNCATCGDFKANALPYCGVCWFKQKGQEDRANDSYERRSGFTSNPSVVEAWSEQLYERMADGGDDVNWSWLIDQAAERHGDHQDVGGEG